MNASVLLYSLRLRGRDNRQNKSRSCESGEFNISAANHERLLLQRNPSNMGLPRSKE
jgi:hypothetical protein